MKLTKHEFGLALAITALSLFLTARPILLALNSLNPLEGLLVYYIILYSSLVVLSYFGLAIFNIKIKKPIQTFGLLMISFAFFIAVGLSSGYVQYVTTGSFGGVSNIFLQCEDGSSWYAWSLLIHPASSFAVTLDWLLAYGLTPFVLALTGGYLAFDKPKLGFT